MTKWEYCVVYKSNFISDQWHYKARFLKSNGNHKKTDDIILVDLIAQLGDVGWELSTFIPEEKHLIFKRPKDD